VRQLGIGSMLPCHTRTRLVRLPTWTPEGKGQQTTALAMLYPEPAKLKRGSLETKQPDVHKTQKPEKGGRGKKGKVSVTEGLEKGRNPPLLVIVASAS